MSSQRRGGALATPDAVLHAADDPENRLLAREGIRRRFRESPMDRALLYVMLGIHPLSELTPEYQELVEGAR